MRFYQCTDSSLMQQGTLNDGRVVAVKQLAVASPQGKTQFLAEIATISAVQHRNLVKLYGCCIEEDNQLLVYEFLENKSLDQALFGKSISSFSLHLCFMIVKHMEPSICILERKFGRKRQPVNILLK